MDGANAAVLKVLQGAMSTDVKYNKPKEHRGFCSYRRIKSMLHDDAANDIYGPDDIKLALVDLETSGSIETRVDPVTNLAFARVREDE